MITRTQRHIIALREISFVVEEGEFVAIVYQQIESFPEQELDQLVTEIEYMSDEDVQQLLAKTKSDE